MELWGLKLTGSGYPQIFSVPIAVKLCVRPQTFYRCKNVLDVLYHYAKLGKTRISPAAGAAKNVEFFVCLSVCLFVTLLNVRECAPDFAMKALDYRNVLIPLDRGRLVVVHPCSTFSDWCQLATPLNTEVQTPAKIGVFHLQRATE